MAARILQSTVVEALLIEGKGGVFDVEVDGKLIYSKHHTGRFPKHEEVLEQLPSDL